MPRIETDMPEKEKLVALKKSVSKLLIASLILNLILIGIIVPVSTNESIRFAATHPVEVKLFSEGYKRVEDEAKQASSDVLKQWVEGYRFR